MRLGLFETPKREKIPGSQQFLDAPLHIDVKLTDH